MRIVTVTMVRNEQDIVEAFVRYHTALVDHMVILDNGSSDLTSEILAKLQEEGLPLHVVNDSEPAFVQSESVTALVRDAFVRLEADLVVPLDVDEFVAARTHGETRRELEKLSSCEATYLEWITYVPLPDDPQVESNPLVRIRNRRATQHNHDSKVIIPRALFEADPDLVVSQGSHHLSDSNGLRLAPKPPSGKLALLHYPVRSALQMQSKYLVGWLANLARPTRVLFDWLPAYNRAKRRVPNDDEVAAAALHYNILDKDVSPGLVEDPADLSHVGTRMRLKYTPAAPIDVLRNVLNYAEELADSVSVARGRSVLGDPRLTDKFILRTIGPFQTIGGWLSAREAALLYRIAASLTTRRPAVCEIGSWLGRSSYVIASALKSTNQNGRLYCVDPLDGSGDATSALLYADQMAMLDGTLEEMFWRNMKRLRVDDHIELIRTRSEKAAGLVPDTIDFLFIDGDHSLEAVTNDFLLYAPRVRRGGFIALHDVGSTCFNGPKTVVEQFIVPSQDWSTHTLVDELFVARRAGSPDAADDAGGRA